MSSIFGGFSMNPRAAYDAKCLLGRHRQSLDDLLAEDAARLGLIELRGRDGPGELAPPDLLDAPGDLGHPVGQEVGETGEDGGRQERNSGRAEQAFPDAWPRVARGVWFLSAPAFR